MMVIIMMMEMIMVIMMALFGGRDISRPMRWG